MRSVSPQIRPFGFSARSATIQTVITRPARPIPRCSNCPTGKQGRGVFAGIFADNTITVYVENADTPRNGDLIVITSAAGHEEQLGNLYIVVTENGSTTLPIQNVATAGNIRGAQGIQGPKGDPGPQGPTGPAGAPGGGVKYMHIMQLSLMSPSSQYNVRDGWFVVYSNQSAPYTNDTLLSALGGSTSTRFPAYGYVYLYSGGTDFYPISCITLTTYGIRVYFRTTPTGGTEELQGVGITDGVIQVG